MNNEILHIANTALPVTLRCNLKCKHCLEFSPYYGAVEDYNLTELCNSIDIFFKLIDRVDNFTIAGGEALLHKDLNAVIQKVGEHAEQIGKIIFTTNGTLLMTDELISLLKQMPKIEVNISDYGPALSKMSQDLQKDLSEAEIPFRVFKYYGNNMHYGGWIDFTDHRIKHRTEDELLDLGVRCGNRKGGNFIIMPGELYVCFRVIRRISLGIIPKSEDSCIDLYSAKGIEDKRTQVREILKAPYTPACAYCVGKLSEVEHCKPAIQLADDENLFEVELL
ncbi:radical SAM protein [Sedimentibacter sp. B4]|uniref:radical SAM protein n=1 Tax=Sedimentibacter sp. B4 TaxID=304766 RepID=UPI0002E85179|nr:radical SAM protein [Sedimentibacter sp. B4]